MKKGAKARLISIHATDWYDQATKQKKKLVSLAFKRALSSCSTNGDKKEKESLIDKLSFRSGDSLVQAIRVIQVTLG